MKRVAVAVGDEIAGARVIEILARGRAPATTRRLAYRVTCVRCGHERIVRHVSLLERITRGSVDCNSCKTRAPDAQKQQSPGGSDRSLGFNNSNAMEQNNARQ